MGKTKLEYIWLDNTNGLYTTIRSKTKIVSSDLGEIKFSDIPKWSDYLFEDGSLVKCILKPVKIYDNKGDNSHIILCEVMNLDKSPHEVNFRHGLISMLEDNEIHFGFEQEYFITNNNGQQPRYDKNNSESYCGIGSNNVFLRDLAEEHLDMCLCADLDIVGINAELTIGQWEFQIGHNSKGIDSCDDLVVARYLLGRLSEKYGVTIEYKSSPQQGHHLFCHINFSTKQMSKGIDDDMVHNIRHEFLEANKTHLEEFGDNNERFEVSFTPDLDEPRVNVNNKESSLNIVQEEKYVEDRRPPANINPYKACQTITRTINKIFE